jgi:hypothetical protein
MSGGYSGHNGQMSADPYPYERDRFIDLIRVVGVSIVVLGHWSVMMVFWEDDVIRGVNALSVIPALRLVTWVMQVMPLMFFIGGFANAAAFRRRDRSYAAFLGDRTLRLLWPTAVFLIVWMGLGIVEEIVDFADPSVLRRAADVAALPFWFLGIYLVAVGLAPAMEGLHRRFGTAVPIALGGGAVAVDVVARGIGAGDVGAVNYLFVWLLAHQLGFFYDDGSLQRGGIRLHAAMTLVGLGGMIGLVTVGTYPVSMVEVPGEPVSNTAPPSIALVFLTLWLVGLAMLLRPWLLRWLDDARRRRVVTRLNRVALSAYLWHVTAITAAIAVLYPLGFPQPDIGSRQWWALRPAFVASMVPVLALLVWLFGRVEIHPRSRPVHDGFGPVRVAATTFGVFSLAIAILGFGATGFIDMVAADGADLLLFSFNPVQNLGHFAIGALCVAAAVRGDRWARLAATAGAALFLAAGLWEGGGASTFLGMNGVTAAAHVIAGGIGLAGALLAPNRLGMPETAGRV